MGVTANTLDGHNKNCNWIVWCLPSVRHVPKYTFEKCLPVSF